MDSFANNGESSQASAALLPPVVISETTVMKTVAQDTFLGLVEGQAPASDVFNAVRTGSPNKAAAEARRASLVGRALFPASTDLSAITNKRLSLPSRPVKTFSSGIPKLARKSFSPQHAKRRASTFQSDQGSLLAMPMANQLHDLKARIASLEKQLSASNNNQTTGMLKARTRIENLEATVAEKEAATGKFQLECEGWEAEATRLAAELEAHQAGLAAASADQQMIQQLEAKVDNERAKKLRFKDMVAKLRCEIQLRGWKEKWELAVMDANDRDRDAAHIRLEAEVSALRMQVGIGRLDQEELEETVQTQRRRLSELAASRQLLLDSVKAAESTIASLRAELAASRKDNTKEASTLKKDLATLRSTVKTTEAELAAAKERTAELEAEAERVAGVDTEIKDLKATVARLEKAGKQSEAKELAEVRKALEKEKSKRESVESMAKELKTSLKQAQADLRTANAAVAKKEAEVIKAKKASAKTTALPPVAVLASKKRRSLTHDGSDPVPAATIDDDEDEDEDEEVEAAAPTPAVKVKTVRAHSESEADQSLEELKATAKARSKKAKTPVPPSPTSDASSEAEAQEESEEEEEEAPKPAKKTKVAEKVLADKSTMATGAAKKRKAGVLTDKSSNAVANVKVKVAKVSKAEKPVKTLGLGKKAVANEDADSEPAKKKKRTLFGGAKKKFEWSSFENADVNGLGIPIALSPIKPAAKGVSSLGGLGLSRSIFG